MGNFDSTYRDYVFTYERSKKLPWGRAVSGTRDHITGAIVFDFVGLFFVDILVRNLSLPPQTKYPRYGPEPAEDCTQIKPKTATCSDKQTTITYN